MAFGIGRGLVTLLLVINCVLYLVGAGLAAWDLNRNVDSQNQIGENIIGDYVTTWFLPLALMACMMGLASVLAGIRHIFTWRGDSLSVAVAASLIAWILDLLAMGFAAKEVDSSGGWRPGRLKTLEAFVIVLAVFELLYLLSLYEPNFENESVNTNFSNRGNVCNQPNVYNRPSLHNQVSAGHLHNHYHHGSIAGHTHEQRSSPPC